jgi:hypothetical protein
MFYFVLIILYGSSQLLVRAWAELYVSTSGMGLGRALHLNLWYGLGPSFMSRPLVWAWAELYISTSGMGLDRAQSTPFIERNGLSFLWAYFIF